MHSCNLFVNRCRLMEPLAKARKAKSSCTPCLREQALGMQWPKLMAILKSGNFIRCHMLLHGHLPKQTLQDAARWYYIDWVHVPGRVESVPNNCARTSKMSAEI